MADYAAVCIDVDTYLHGIQRVRSIVVTELLYADAGGGTTMTTYWLNRGRTAAGVCVEWTSEGAAIDTTGAFYTALVPPWVDIVEVIGLRTWVA